MKTCFVCGARADWMTESLGHPVCDDHRKLPGTGPVAWVPDDDTRLAAIQRWHAGSAYEKDQAMAKRLEGVG